MKSCSLSELPCTTKAIIPFGNSANRIVSCYCCFVCPGALEFLIHSHVIALVVQGNSLREHDFICILSWGQAPEKLVEHEMLGKIMLARF